MRWRPGTSFPLRLPVRLSIRNRNNARVRVSQSSLHDRGCASPARRSRWQRGLYRCVELRCTVLRSPRWSRGDSTNPMQLQLMSPVPAVRRTQPEVASYASSGPATDCCYGCPDGTGSVAPGLGVRAVIPAHGTRRAAFIGSPVSAYAGPRLVTFREMTFQDAHLGEGGGATGASGSSKVIRGRLRLDLAVGFLDQGEVSLVRSGGHSILRAPPAVAEPAGSGAGGRSRRVFARRRRHTLNLPGSADSVARLRSPRPQRERSGSESPTRTAAGRLVEQPGTS